MYCLEDFETRLLQEFSYTLIFYYKQECLIRIHHPDDRDMKPTNSNILTNGNHTLAFRVTNGLQKREEIRCFFPIMFLHSLRKKQNERVLGEDADGEKKAGQEYSSNEASAHRHGNQASGVCYFSGSKETGHLHGL